MRIEIHDKHFDPWEALQAYQATLPAGQYGACNVFVGTMRDFNEGDDVSEMFLEHYPGMTEKHLQHIAEEAVTHWSLLDAIIIHRVGTIRPNDPIVLVAAWSAHRKAAFEASRFMIEDLKHKAPFWKREATSQGERWVEKNTTG